MSKYQYFTVDETFITIPEPGSFAIFCGDAPRRNEAEGITTHSLRAPLLIMPQGMWNNPEGVAAKVAKILNDNAHLFFDSAEATT